MILIKNINISESEDPYPIVVRLLVESSSDLHHACFMFIKFN